MAVVREWIAGASVLALLLFAGCSSLQRVPVHADATHELAPLDRKDGMEIVAYSTPDGLFHGFHGRARWTSAAHDTLELTGKRRAHVDGAEPSGDANDHDPVTIRLAREQVTTLLFKGVDPGKSSLVGFGTVTAVILGAAALFIALAGGLEE